MMNKDQQPHFFSQIDVSNTPPPSSGAYTQPQELLTRELCLLVRQLLTAQDRQNALLEEMVEHFSLAQRQRTNDLAMWKKANPELAFFCKKAADQLGKIQSNYLSSITDEIQDNCDTMMDSEFMFNDFIDRFGPRFANLNSILQVLAQLGNAPDAAPSPRKVK